MSIRHTKQSLIAPILAVAALISLIPAGITGSLDVQASSGTSTQGKTISSDISGTTVETITVDGEQRQYRLHVPPTYDSSKPVALVISLHGFTSNATQEEQLTQFSTKADQEGFIVAYPEGTGQPQRWYFGPGPNSNQDADFISQLIDSLESHYSIDRKRIYANGISNGAQESYHLACTLADKIAAFGFVSGSYLPLRLCNTPRAVAIVVFHGTDDQLLSYNGRPPLFLPVPQFVAQWAAQNGCAATPAVTYQKGDVTGQTWSQCKDNAEVVFYTIKGKGHSWPGSNMPAAITTKDINATDVMWDFFAAHPLSRI